MFLYSDFCFYGVIDDGMGFKFGIVDCFGICCEGAGGVMELGLV